MLLGQNFPELIRPFSHGIEFRPGRGYSYIGALYNIFVCAGVGIIVTFFTKPKTEKQLSGLTIFDVHNLKNIFKGSSVNEEKGESINVTWKIKEIDSDLVCFSINDMNKMKANPGDLVFVEDSRWWLGGLKSAHCIYGEPHNEDGLVYITNKHLSHGQFIEGLKLKAEKEM